MKEKKKISIINAVLLAIIVITCFAIYKMHSQNLQLRKSLPYFLTGEKIDYFDLTGMDSGTVDASIFKTDKPALVFIFSRPCSPCNKNLVFWKKMSLILKDKANIYGIVLDDVSSAYNFAREANLNFDIYVPDHLETFINRMRIKLNLPQTILYHNGVKMQKLGILKGNEVAGIINLVKKI